MYKDEDEIDLKELFYTIKQRKNLILGITSIMTLLAIVYAFMFAKQVYEVKAMIEIGKLDSGTKDEIPLADINDVKQKLEYLYGVNSKKKRAYPRVKAISVAKKSKSIFAVVVEGRDNQSAQKRIDEVVNALENAYAQKIKTYIDTKNELISLTQNDITTSQKNLKDTAGTLKDYTTKMLNITEKDAALAGLYTIQISQNQLRVQSLQARISALKTKAFNLKLSIAPLRITQTHIVGQVEVLDKPVKPKKVLIVIVTFITGLMFSIFFVFFLSFLQGLKEEK